jgi:cytochrome c oxidase subunit II
VSSPSRGRLRRTATVVLGTAALGLLTTCSPVLQRGWLPTGEGTTDRTDAIVQLWTGSWIAALLVGVLVWGLIVWCVIAYRKRKDDHQLPVQLRYHLPLELLYTFVPILMVGVLFFYTVRVQDTLLATDEQPDVNIEVYGRQWAWDFNYLDEDVWDSGTPSQMSGEVTSDESLTAFGEQPDLPTLVLPVDQTVEFTLHSRDVIHSFWIPAFLYKLDMIPGRTNTFQVTPQEEGDYYGKCAELCGEYHGYMLFNVQVVTPEEYEAHIADLEAAGQTGRLGEEYNRTNIPEIPSRDHEGEEG